MSTERIASVFDEWAAGGRDASMENGHKDVVEQVVGRLGIGPGQQILDLGCGNGWATRLLAKSAAGSGAVGVDASPAMIGRAEELHSFTIRARYEVMPFHALDFKDGHFDRAFSMEAIYYAPDVDAALAETARVLKAGGRVDLLLDFWEGRPCVSGWPDGVGLPMHHATPEQWAERLAAAGFDDVRTEHVVDRRGAGDEAAFEPSAWYPTWADRVAFHDAGTLWISGVR